jgi:hypothetical protein
MALNINSNFANIQAVKATATVLQRDLVVDLSPEPAKAKVVREGYQVPVVALNPTQSNFFLDNLTPILPHQEPRVVAQTVPAGTKVLPGASVDLVLATKTTIPFDIFDTVHANLKGQTIDVLDPLLDQSTVRQTLLKYNSPADVTPEDKLTLTAAFNQSEVLGINETNSTTSFATAFTSARSALAFR